MKFHLEECKPKIKFIDKDFFFNKKREIRLQEEGKG